MEAAEKALLREALVYDFEVSDEMAGASPELGQEMELLLYGRLGHYSRSVERLRARAEKQRAELHAARLLQRLSRGQRGRALVKAKRTEIQSVAANLGAATSIQSAFKGYKFRRQSGRPQRQSLKQGALAQYVEFEEKAERQAEREAHELRRSFLHSTAVAESVAAQAAIDEARQRRMLTAAVKVQKHARALQARLLCRKKLDHRRTRRQELIATSGSSKLLVESSRGTF